MNYNTIGFSPAPEPVSPALTSDNALPLRNTTFENAKRLGVDAISGTVDHYYTPTDNSGMLMRTRQISDTVLKRFSERRAVESLGLINGGHCPYCGDKMFSLNKVGRWEKVEGVNFEWDHLIPASVLGLSVDGNICAACKDCNQLKSDMDPQAFFDKLLADPTKKTLYGSSEDFRKFFNEFSKPYRHNYPDAFARSKMNSESGVTLDELESQIGDLWKSRDSNGDKILTVASGAKRASQLDSFFEAFKTEYYPKKEGSKNANSTVTFANKLQEICDALYDPSNMDSDLKEWPADALWTLIEEYFTFYRAEPDTTNNSSTFGLRLRCIRDFAAALDRADFNILVEKVPTYKMFMEYGFISPLSAEEEARVEQAIRDAEAYAQAEALSTTDTKALLEKAPNFREKLRVFLDRKKVTSSDDLTPADILDLFSGYVENYKRGEGPAKKFCSMYTKQLPAAIQVALIQEQLNRLTNTSDSISIDQLL